VARSLHGMLEDMKILFKDMSGGAEENPGKS
jgi:hypothetical protein